MNTPSLPSSVHGIPFLNDICGENLNISTSDLSSNQEVNTFQASSQHGKRENALILRTKEDTQEKICSEGNDKRLEKIDYPIK